MHQAKLILKICQLIHQGGQQGLLERTVYVQSHPYRSNSQIPTEETFTQHALVFDSVRALIDVES